MQVTIAGRDISVRELTINEIRFWLSEVIAGAKSPDVLNEIMLFEGITLRELAMFTDMAPEQIERFKPSDIAPLARAVLEINPLWYDARKRIVDIGTKLQAAQALQAQAGK